VIGRLASGALAAALAIGSAGPFGLDWPDRLDWGERLELSDLRRFLGNPANLPYLVLAQRLSELPPDRLQSVAEGLRALTP